MIKLLAFATFGTLLAFTPQGGQQDPVHPRACYGCGAVFTCSSELSSLQISCISATVQSGQCIGDWPDCHGEPCSFNVTYAVRNGSSWTIVVRDENCNQIGTIPSGSSSGPTTIDSVVECGSSDEVRFYLWFLDDPNCTGISSPAASIVMKCKLCS